MTLMLVVTMMLILVSLLMKMVTDANCNHFDGDCDIGVDSGGDNCDVDNGDLDANSSDSGDGCGEICW